MHVLFTVSIASHPLLLFSLPLSSPLFFSLPLSPFLSTVSVLGLMSKFYRSFALSASDGIMSQSADLEGHTCLLGRLHLRSIANMTQKRLPQRLLTLSALSLLVWIFHSHFFQTIGWPLLSETRAGVGCRGQRGSLICKGRWLVWGQTASNFRLIENERL